MKSSQKPIHTSRRSALRQLTLLTGIAFSSNACLTFLSGCKVDFSESWTSTVFTEYQFKLIESIIDRILPATETPGALECQVARYIDEALRNNYSEDKQVSFLTQIEEFDRISRSKYKKRFTELSNQKKDDVLQIMVDRWKSKPDEAHIFPELRDLTITGFATSETGAKQFFIYNSIPGPFEGCISIDKVNGTYSLG